MQALLESEQADLGELAPVFTGLAVQRQQELRAAAEPLGIRLYAAAPHCAVDQLGRLWEGWKAA
jgi:hypothetical protein